MTPPAIGIAGAGIAGLTAALALAERGWPVEVFEQAERLDAIGAGLQLSPNASGVLIGLGLRQALTARATLLDGIRIHSSRRGGELAIIRLDSQSAARAEAPYWVIHRADLQSVLMDSVRAHPSITVRLGCSVNNVSVGARAVTVLAGGEQHDVAALIGADGVWSALRPMVCDNVPKFSGLVAWRGTIASKAIPHSGNFVDLWMSANAHLVTYPIENGARINLVLILRGDAATRTDTPCSTVLFAQSDWPAAPRALVNACGRMTAYPLYILPDLARWTAGPFALMGDAAHAMLPFAAQGAGMAIEDAAVLARCLGEARSLSQGELATALARYAGLRRHRVTRVAATARRLGRIYHMHGVIGAARDLAIQSLGGKTLLAQQRWIYDWKPSQ